MPASDSLANLIVPQQGKMRQISSQGRQASHPLLAKAIGDAPGKSVQIQASETFTIVRIWMTTMQPMPGLLQPLFGAALLLGWRADPFC